MTAFVPSFGSRTENIVATPTSSSSRIGAGLDRRFAEFAFDRSNLPGWRIYPLLDLASQGVIDGSSIAFLNARKGLMEISQDIPTPEISIDDDGSVSLDWMNEWGSYFSMSFEDNGFLSYACRYQNQNIGNGRVNYKSVIPPYLLMLLRDATSR